MYINFAIVLLISTVSSQGLHEREKRQINFGGPSSSSSSSSPSSSVSFSNNNNGKKTSLTDILKKFGKSPPEVNNVNTRFNFNFGGSRRYGSSCSTPRGERGTCRYITDSPCNSILSLIVGQGVSPSILQYLFAAIRSPCGFEGFDFTLCCADPNSQPTPGPTPAPTPAPTPPPSQRCGMSQANKIVGGTLANPGRWPWAVIVGRAPTFGGRFTVQCGGTLLNEDTVLTAAHCFDGGSSGPTHIRAGDTDISSSNDGSGIDISIGRVINHPGWNSRTLDNDISIIKLSRPLSYSRSVRWACLPSAFQKRNLTSTLTNPNPTIIGWGSTRTGGNSETRLRQVRVPMVTQNYCSRAYENVGQVNIGDTKICAGVGGRDSCNGDSGGPLLSDRLEGGWAVVGITSFGVECARDDFPGVYTRVDKYLPWIQQNL